MSASLAIIASVAGVALLALFDPKRGRAVGEMRPPAAPPFKWTARALIFAPGAILALQGAWSPFAIWIGAVSVIGWGVAAMPVGGWAKLAWRARKYGRSLFSGVSTEFDSAVGTLSRAFGALTSGSRRVRDLEARVKALEAEVQRLRKATGEPAERKAA